MINSNFSKENLPTTPVKCVYIIITSSKVFVSPWVGIWNTATDK